MQPLERYAPTSLPQALELLQQLDGRAQVIAGGTDLMLKMKKGALAPRAVVNIKRLPELKGISAEADGGLRIGALTTLRELTRSAPVLAHYPSLAQAAGWMASEQVRSFATIGGNLCNAAPSADLAPPLIALDAAVTLAGAAGPRQLALEEFFLGPGKTALQPGELLLDIHLPPPAGRTLYFKQAPRAFMDIAVVGVAAGLLLQDGHCRDARIVLGAVAPTPLRVHQAEAALRGRSLAGRGQRAAAFAEAAGLAAEACAPIDDVRSSAWYRRQMVQVVTRRALEQLAGQ